MYIYIYKSIINADAIKIALKIQIEYFFNHNNNRKMWSRKLNNFQTKNAEI